jgi:bifunctional non-homologous end joining protein LigD
VAKEGGEVDHAVCNSQAALVYLANQNCVAFHVWLSRVSHIDKPDRVTFDLDPSDGGFEKVREAAFIFKDMLAELGLVPHVMMTGSRGAHVVAPLRRGEPFDNVRAFARGLAKIAAAKHPDLLTVEQRKEKRGERVYVDTLRNSYGHTAVAPYSVRVKPGAPVATPLTWEEFEDRTIGPQTYNIRNILERTERTGDPWAGMAQHARSLRQLGERLEVMRAAR